MSAPRQQQLFDAGKTEPRRCSRGCKKKDICQYDGDLAHGIVLAGKRPKSCLNAYEPKTAPFPAGY